MPPVSTQTINFDSERKATAVLPTLASSANEIAKALDLPVFSSVLLLIGGANSLDEKLKPQLTQFFGRGIARAAIISNAVIIDGGTEAGVMQLMGEGVAARGYKSSLVGVAPLDLVKYPGSTGAGETPLDPNHSHFVLVPVNTWGGETSTIFKLVAELSANKQPVVTLLVGGGGVCKNEVLQAVRQNLPLLIVAGTGGFADEVVGAHEAKPATPADPVMAEIIADGQIEIIQLKSSVKSAERAVVRHLGSDNVLLQAWDIYADYDSNATVQQHRFGGVELSILIIGVLATALALIKQVFAAQSDPTHFITSVHGWWFSREEVKQGKADVWIGWWMLKYVLIMLPILVTILITATNKFKQGNKWLLLRAGAESLKREIYRYRVRSGDYGPDPNPPPVPGSPNNAAPRPTPDQVLAQRVENITRGIMQTDVNTTSIVPFDMSKNFPPTISKRDDGFSLLTPARYIQVRLDDQAGYYKRQTVKLNRRFKLIQWAIYIVGGLGTLLAAIDQQVWIALTTAVATALVTFLGYKQTENTLTKFNQAGTNLKNVRRWWTALPPEEQAKQTTVNTLVDHTERVLQSELDGWVQQMQNALAQLRKGQPQVADAGTSSQPITTGVSTATTKVAVQPTVAGAPQQETGGDPDDTVDDNGGTSSGDNDEAPPPDDQNQQ